MSENHPSDTCRRSALVVSVCAGVLVVLVLLVFGRTVTHEFVSWDDGFHIYENPAMNPVTAAKLARFWRRPQDFPLTYTFWSVQARLVRRSAPGRPAGVCDPRVFHAANVMLHALNALLVFSVLLAVFETGAGWRGALACACGAALFAVHPVQVEPVAWVSAAKDLLSTCFALIALRVFLAGLRTAPGARRAVRLRLVCCGLLGSAAFALGLFSKPTAVVTAPIAVVLGYRLCRGSAAQAWAVPGSRIRFVAFGLCLPLLWAAASLPLLVLSKSGQPDSAITFVTPWPARPLVAVDALGFYLYKLFVPLRLGPDYGRSPHAVLSAGIAPWAAAAAVLLGVAVLAWSLRGRGRWIPAALVVFAVGLLPELGLVPFGFQDISTVADRYLYLPMLGAALAVAGWAHAALSRWPGRVALAVLIALSAVRSTVQARIWHDSVSLFAHALRLNPDSYPSHNNLGKAFVEKGKPEDAMRHYEAALRIRPEDAKVRNNMGLAFTKLGRRDRAIACFRDALEQDAGYADAHNNLGAALSERGQTDAAVRHWQRALALNPLLAETHNNLGHALAGRGDADAAMRHYRIAIALNPHYARAYDNLGVALFDQGRLDQAIRHYRTALALAPDAAASHNNMGLALARKGKTAAAMAAYSTAIRLDPDLLVARNNLGNAFLSMNRLDEAQRCYASVLARAPNHAESLNNLGVVMGKRGRHAEALRYFSAAVRERPDYAEARRNLELARSVLGAPIERGRDALPAPSRGPERGEGVEPPPQ